MGVLACERRGCDGIMCDRVSTQFGYICNECFDEMVASQIIDIDSFMNATTVASMVIPRTSYERMFPRRNSR